MIQQEAILQKLNSIEALLLNQKSKPLTLQEASSYLNISPSHLYKLTSQAKIPHFKPTGKKLYFNQTELNQWLLRNPVKTHDDLEEQAIDHVMTRGAK